MCSVFQVHLSDLNAAARLILGRVTVTEWVKQQANEHVCTVCRVKRYGAGSPVGRTQNSIGLRHQRRNLGIQLVHSLHIVDQL